MLFRAFLLSSLILASSQAQELDERNPRSGYQLPDFLQRFDANEDGEIDEEERQAIRDYRRGLREEGRNTIDANDDEIISQDEIDSAREAIRERIHERRLDYFQELAGDDEFISYEEFLAAPGFRELPVETQEAIFIRLDTDESGNVSVDEFLRRLRPNQAKRKLITPALPEQPLDADDTEVIHLSDEQNVPSLLESVAQALSVLSPVDAEQWMERFSENTSFQTSENRP